MARAGYRIFDADTHIIEPVEPIEAYLSAADHARLAALGPAVQRAPAKGGMSRYGTRPSGADERFLVRAGAAVSTGGAEVLRECDGRVTTITLPEADQRSSRWGS
jgi:hypothetical protein